MPENPSASPPVALITGAGKKRIGWHVAQALADRGYALAIHYHTSAQEAAETVDQLVSRSVPAHAYQAELADEQAVKRMIEAVVNRYGRIDAVINTAAIWPRKPLEEVTADDVRRNFEVNTLGTFLTCQQAGLVMVSQPQGGCLINFGDWACARPYLGYSSYFPSKGAIPTLTRCLAVELGTRNPRVRVNAILPGPAMLPADLPEDERNQVIKATLVKREGSPQHIVQAVLYLLETDFVTGTCLPVDGGRTIYAGGN